MNKLHTTIAQGRRRQLVFTQTHSQELDNFNEELRRKELKRRGYDTMKDVTPKNEPTEILALDNIDHGAKT